MENAISYLNANPIFWVVLGILAVLLIIAIVKKAFKLLIIIAIIAVVYLGYLFFTGKVYDKESFNKELKNIPESIKKVGSDAAEEVKKHISPKEN